MNKKLKKFAALILIPLGLALFLSIGMSFWMHEEPMPHGEHECCDFLPMNANEPVVISFLLLLPSVVFLSFFVYSYKSVEGINRFRFAHAPLTPPSRRMLRGVVQLE